MSNDIATQNKNDLSFWNDPTKLKEVKQLFAPNLTDLEFAGFVGMGKALSLNPFLREIWAIKYDKSKPAQIFIGRDGYRKVAQRQAEYDYHYSEAIYSKDIFKVMNGVIHHEYTFIDRGVLLGAYCIVKRKSSSRPTHVVVNLADYDKKHSNWNTMKDTMIRKVAEAQALRAAFQDTFGGTYTEDELPDVSHKSNTEKLKEKLNIETGEILDAELINDDVPTHSSEFNITLDQLTTISDLLKEKNFTEKRKQDVLKHYKVDSFEKLTNEQAIECIVLLDKSKATAVENNND